jgi:hypothetical protein
LLLLLLLLLLHEVLAVAISPESFSCWGLLFFKIVIWAKTDACAQKLFC